MRTLKRKHAVGHDQGSHGHANTQLTRAVACGAASEASIAVDPAAKGTARKLQGHLEAVPNPIEKTSLERSSRVIHLKV